MQRANVVWIALNKDYDKRLLQGDDLTRLARGYIT